MGKLNLRALAEKVNQQKQVELEEKDKHNPRDYGDNLYVVKVIPSVSKTEEVALWADSVEVIDGNLVFTTDSNIIMSFATTQWKSFYIADDNYQFPLCVDRWPGVAGVRVISQKDITEEELTKIVMRYVEENPHIKDTILNQTLEMNHYVIKGVLEEMGQEVLESLLDKFTDGGAPVQEEYKDLPAEEIVTPE